MNVLLTLTNIRLWRLTLAVFMVVTNFAPSATFAYDGQDSTNLAYDSSRESAVVYDAVVEHTTDATRNRTTGYRAFFAKFAEFLAAGTGLPKGITFDATVHRAVDPKYADTAFNFHTPSNLGAPHRYTDVGRGGIYSGTSREAVLGELAHYGVDPSKAAWVTKNVRVDNVLDLTNPAVRKQLGIRLDQITGDSYFYTHALGDFARGQGYGGILFPSARAPGTSSFVEFINHAR